MRVVCTVCNTEVALVGYRTFKCTCFKTTAYVNDKDKIISVLGKPVIFCGDMDDLKRVANMFCGASTKVVMGNNEQDTGALGLYDPSNERHVKCLYCHNQYVLAPSLPHVCKCKFLSWHFEKQANGDYHLSWIAGRFDILDLKNKPQAVPNLIAGESSLVPSAGATRSTTEPTSAYSYHSHMRDGAVECNLGDD